MLYAPRRPYFFESEGTGMKGYKHLTEFDRNKIARMRKEGATMREIGAALHVSATRKSTAVLKRGSAVKPFMPISTRAFFSA